MPQRNVATNFTFEQQRAEINLLAQDFWAQKGTVDTASTTYLKHDGSNAFTGQTLAVPNAFTINSNSGNGTVTISGNLDVTGTTTTVSSANLEVTDKNILISKGSTTDAQADGAGITIDSDTDITWNFVDANDAWVSSIGIEATTHLKAARGQFTGATSPTTGYGVEINAPDANTGQIIAYNRDSAGYKELRLRASSVPIYTGTTNTIVGTFNSTGLTMESGKTLGVGVAPKSGEGSELAVKGSDGATNIALIPGSDTESSQIAFYNAAYDSQQGYIKYDNNDNSLQFRVNLQPRLHIKNDGDIAIGHTSPTARLDVRRGDADGKIAEFHQNTGYGIDIGSSQADAYISSGYNQSFIFKTDAAGGAGQETRLVITPTGQVLIGDSTASSLGDRVLQIGKTDRTATYVELRTATNGVGGIVFSDGTAADNTGYRGTIEYAHGGTNSDSLFFKTAAEERFRITSTGQVKIGNNPTIDANTNLHIEDASSECGVIIEGNTAGAGAYLLLRNNNTNSDPRTYIGGLDASGQGTSQIDFYNLSDANNEGEIRFSTRPSGGSMTEALKITSGGDIKIPGGGYLDFYGSRTTYRHTGSYGEFKNPTGDLYCSVGNDYKFGNGDFSVEYLTIKKDTGHVLPGADNTQDLGSTTKRWANVYTGDLNLCNEGSYNEVDGTSGSWTMQEGDSDLFLINRKSGKKYKFNLTEVS